MVTGLFILALVLPAEEGFDVDRLDICCPMNQSNAIKEYFEVQGYTQTKEEKSQNAKVPINKLTILEKDGQRVEIIMGSGHSPLQPFLHLHNTALMNYASSEGIFISYPELTFQYHGIINPVKFRNSNVSIRMIRGLQHLQVLGFRLLSSTQS